MDQKKVMLIAVLVIFAVVLLLTYLRVFSSYVLVGVIFVLYIVVSLYNRRRFKRQAEARPTVSGR